MVIVDDPCYERTNLAPQLAIWKPKLTSERQATSSTTWVMQAGMGLDSGETMWKVQSKEMTSRPLLAGIQFLPIVCGTVNCGSL